MTVKTLNAMSDCICGRPAREHDFTRRSPGHAETNCLCYRVENARRLAGEALAVEMQHWSHHVGNPVGTPQMQPAEINVARVREVEFQRSTVLQRTIEAARADLKQRARLIEITNREIAEAEAELLKIMTGDELQVAA